MPRSLNRLVTMFLAVSIVLALLAPTPISSRTVVAQEEPPRVGSVVLDEALTAPRFFRQFSCPTGRGDGRFGPDGLTLRTSGRCFDDFPQAAAQVGTFWATVVDGDVEVEARVNSGRARAYLVLQARIGLNGEGYSVWWHPSGGVIRLVRSDEDGEVAVLAEQTGLRPPAPGGWTRLSLRFQEDRIWVLIDGRTVLTATDDWVDEGGVSFGVIRRPKGLAGARETPGQEPFDDIIDDLDPDDREEVSVTWRKLRISALTGGSTARAPSVLSPAERPPSSVTSVLPFVPAAGTPPVPSDVVVEEALDGPSVIPTFDCPTKRGAVITVGEGLMLKANGMCRNGASLSAIQAEAPGMTVPDGEARVEFKVVNGQRVAAIGIAARFVNSYKSYAFGVAPTRAIGFISKVENGEDVALAHRSDLRSLIILDEWNSIAVRLFGGELWLLVNDRPALKAQDESISSGGFALIVGGIVPDGSQETAVVFRNLRISAIDGAPEERRPSYSPPAGTR